MNKNLKKFAVLLLAAFMLAGLCGCGSKAAYDMSESEYYAKDYDYEEISGLSTSASDATYVFSNLQNKNLKMVYTAEARVQTEDFDETLTAIVSLVDEMGGYFESSQVYNGGYYYSSLRSGYYTIRIPSENYSGFINQLSASWHVVNLSQNAEDISESYADVEGHLETLRIKQSRLQELLKQASSMSDILTIESELSDVEYEINKYTGQLNKYDSLVGYSTINLDLDEVSQYSDSVSAESFFVRLGRAFTNGAKNFVSGLGNFALWFARNIIALVIIAAIVFVVCKFHLLKKIFRKKKKEEK